MFRECSLFCIPASPGFPFPYQGSAKTKQQQRQQQRGPLLSSPFTFSKGTYVFAPEKCQGLQCTERERVGNRFPMKRLPRARARVTSFALFFSSVSRILNGASFSSGGRHKRAEIKAPRRLFRAHALQALVLPGFGYTHTKRGIYMHRLVCEARAFPFFFLAFLHQLCTK